MLLFSLLHAVLLSQLASVDTLIIGNLGILTMNVLNTISVPLKLPELFLFSSIMAFAFSTVNYAAMTAMLLECPAPPYRGTGIFIAGTMFTAGTLIGMICGTDALLGRRPFALVGEWPAQSLRAINERVLQV